MHIIQGDCRAVLREQLPERHFHCCMTSPPYFGLRKYGDNAAEEIGSEATPDEFLAGMADVFGGVDNNVGVWRVLRDDGVLWVNLADSYASGSSGAAANPRDERTGLDGCAAWSHKYVSGSAKSGNGIKPKDLCGIPWMFALMMRANGWF